MQTRPFGSLGTVSALTLGGGGIAQIWGPTTRHEAVATTREAVDSGITLLDVAPSYGDGEAERVIGEAFGGRLPDGVRITTKCRLGSPPAADVPNILEASLRASMERTKLQRFDLFFLHNLVVPEDWPDASRGTTRSLLLDTVIPAFERLQASGLIGGWGLTGIGLPDVLIDLLDSGVRPAAIQIMANLLDSPGNLKRYEGPAKPREIMAAALRAGVPIMGIRAVQAGALTDAIDRPLPDDHPEMQDYRRAAPFRAIAADLGESPASLAHRYALSIDGVGTVVLGVKNREELHECFAAEAAGPLSPDLIVRIDAAVGRSSR